MNVPSKIPSLSEVVIEDINNPGVSIDRILMQCDSCNILAAQPIENTQITRINYDITNPHNEDFIKILHHLNTLKKASVLLKADESISKTSPRWFMSPLLNEIPKTQAEDSTTADNLESTDSPFALLPKIYDLLIKAHVPASIYLKKVADDKYSVQFLFSFKMHVSYLHKHEFYGEFVDAIQEVDITNTDKPSTRMFASRVNTKTIITILQDVIESLEAYLVSKE